MTRERLVALLDYLVREGILPSAEARTILGRFDRGMLDDPEGFRTLEALAEADRVRRTGDLAEVQDREIGFLEAVAAAVALWLIGRTYTEEAPPSPSIPSSIKARALAAARATFGAAAARVTISPALTFAAAFEPVARLMGTAGVANLAGTQGKLALSRQLVEAHHSVSRSLARALAQGMPTHEWRYLASVQIRDHYHAQAILGSGRPLTFEQRRLADRAVRRELRHLRRFAAEIEARKAAQLQGLRDGRGRAIKALSERQVGARLGQYAGSGTAAFYRSSEAGLDNNVVVDYFAQDDGGTCSPCLVAQAGSPYLPGEGPMPGDVCRAGGRCRCERRSRYDPEAAARLRGEPVPAGVAA